MTTLLSALGVILKIVLTIILVNASIAFLGGRLARTDYFKEKMRRKYGP
jgi:hypothetical protein